MFMLLILMVGLLHQSVAGAMSLLPVVVRRAAEALIIEVRVEGRIAVFKALFAMALQQPKIGKLRLQRAGGGKLDTKSL